MQFWKTKSSFGNDFMKHFLAFLTLENFYHSSVKKAKNFFYDHCLTHSNCI